MHSLGVTFFFMGPDINNKQMAKFIIKINCFKEEIKLLPGWHYFLFFYIPPAGSGLAFAYPTFKSCFL